MIRLFEAAERGKFTDSGYAGRIHKFLSNSGVSTIVYLRKKCETLPSATGELLLRYNFCVEVISESSDVQCYYSRRRYQEFAGPAIRAAANAPIVATGTAVKVANERES